MREGENNNRSQQFGAVKLGVGVEVAAQSIWAAFCFYVEKHPKGGVDLTHTRAFLIKESHWRINFDLGMARRLRDSQCFLASRTHILRSAKYGFMLPALGG